MAKEIKNPIQVQLHFDRDSGTWELTPSVDYSVGASEYPSFDTRKGMVIALTPEQEAAIMAFGKDVVYPQILANEGI